MTWFQGICEELRHCGCTLTLTLVDFMFCFHTFTLLAVAAMLATPRQMKIIRLQRIVQAWIFHMDP